LCDRHQELALKDETYVFGINMQKECLRKGFYYEYEQWMDRLIYFAIPAYFGLDEKPPKELLCSKFSNKN
jgi:hypothetical protein